MRTTRTHAARALALTGLSLGSLVAAGLPALAYDTVPAAANAACTPASQTVTAGNTLRNLTCTFSYSDASGGPVVAAPFTASSSHARTVGTPPARTDKFGQAVVTFAFLAPCDLAGGTQQPTLFGSVGGVRAQATALGNCTAGVAGATQAAATACAFSQTLTGGINGREDLCTFHTDAANLNGVTFALTALGGNRSAAIVRSDSAPDAHGNFTATVDYYGGDTYTITAALRNSDGSPGPTASQTGSGSGAGTEASYSAVAQAANVRSLVSYTVLSATALTDDGTTHFAGDVGVDTAAAMTTVNSANIRGGLPHTADAESHQANLDGKRAYDAIGALPYDHTFSGDLNGLRLTPGVYYTAAAFTLTGTLTLDGQGDPDAIFIFKVDSALNTAAGSHLVLINGAKASNVIYWVNGAAGTGANSNFEGSILSYGAVTIGNGTAFHGSIYSQAAITLCANKMTAPFA